MTYRVILSDPPWSYYVHSEKGKGRSAEHHYPTMTTAAIAALPVADLADPAGSVLLLWATWPNLPDAMTVLAAWGYTYKTAALVWVKRSPRNTTWHTGMGYWTRGNTEPLLLATRGKGYPRRVAKDVAQLLIAPRQEHSRKPDSQYARIERLFGLLPRVELFARRPWPGWAAWGHGATGDQSLAAFAQNPPTVDHTQVAPDMQQLGWVA